MKFASLIIPLIGCGKLAAAFAPSLHQNGAVRSLTQVRPPSHIFSQWDEENDDVATEKPTSFDDAGQNLKDEDDKKRMDDVGDYDSNPAYNSADIDRVREAIAQRTTSLGIEKSKVSKEAIQAAQERAQSAMADQGSGSQMLDLSQISQTAPRGKDDEVLDIFYDVEDEMTEEEMKEADPDGQMTIPEQVKKEVSLASWPTPLAAIKQIGLLIIIIAFTSTLIIGWDNLLRETYTNLGFIPRPEDIMEGSENLVLPDGWTKGMSEDDFMNFQDEVGKVVSSPSAVLPDL